MVDKFPSERKAPTSAPPRHATGRIGLLGGSFNPAHAGHREISLAALKHLRLDAVWWLVSPGNPLKNPDDYAPYEERLAIARRVADHHRIVISDFERRKSLQYTVDTIDLLRNLWPDMGFVWLMGADSLETFHLWRDWQSIFSALPLAIFNRPGSESAPLSATAARKFADFRVETSKAATILDHEPPVWTFIPDTANPLSSTALRACPNKQTLPRQQKTPPDS